MLKQPTRFSIIFLLPFRLVFPISLKNAAMEAQKNNHRNISIILDNLLRGYDNSIRPDFGGPPAIVEVDIMVRSMGPISEVDMTYSMDCYFRQTWVDRRLAFPGNASDTLALSISMLGRIWKPDTYFYNGKQSYLHTITTPNKFVRLYQDGRVLYSSRLTIKAGCPMNLEDFPMDIQRCPLKFGSFGYTSRDLIYKWNDIRQVAIAEDMKLSQFDLIATPAGNSTHTLTNIDATTTLSVKYSMLLVSFHLQRHMGNFLIQVYGPCVLLVVLSWVSFWLNREATADRVSLGITTILTMTFLGLEARTDLPKVPYPTALDFFVFLAFTFIFATIIQFAVVHYFTKYGSGECYFNADQASDEDSSSADEDWTSLETTEYIARENVGNEISADPNFIEVIQLSACTIPIVVPETQTTLSKWKQQISKCLRKNNGGGGVQEIPTDEQGYLTGGGETRQNSNLNHAHHTTKRRKKKRTPRFNSVSKIDRASRIVFPLLFITINLFYWYFYLSRTKRMRN